MAFFAGALVTIFIVVDPIAISPLFLALTPTMKQNEKLRVMRRAVLVAAGILIAFAAVGRLLLNGLGITIQAFYIAGGILLLLISIDMLFARPSRTRETPEEGEAARQSADISVFPLAIPILAGPGAIATIVLYMSLAGTNVFKIAAVLLALAISLAAAYLSMRLSTLVVRVLGETGINVVGRVAGILLAALAVQFVLNGVASYFHHVLAM
ncbi:MAG: MarC family protein [Chloroflexota bacterium]|nr:MarC family protein [Chloroflexota bacterium]